MSEHDEHVSEGDDPDSGSQPHPMEDIDSMEPEAVADDGTPVSGSAERSDASESMGGLVSYIVTNLVDEPDAVEIDVQQRGSLVQIRLRLPEEELGKVIGRGGRIAKAMRTALMIAGSRHHMRVSLDIES